MSTRKARSSGHQAESAKAGRRGAKAPAGEPWPPVIVLHGQDAGLRSRALQDLLAQADAVGGNVCEFPASAELAEVLDELRTLPFLADRRIVVVRDADEFVSKHRQALEQYLSSPCPTGALVLECRRWPANTRLAAVVKKIGRTVPCEPPSGRNLADWLVRHAADLSKQLAPDAAQMLVDLLGDEQPAMLLTEVEKLATFVGRRKAITAADVEALVSPLRGEKIFAVADAIMDRDAATALSLWEQVLASDRQALYRAVGGLAWAFRRFLKARSLVETGMSAAQAARSAGLWGPQPVLARRLSAFTSRQLAGYIVWLARIDLACKTGADAKNEIERFILTVCSGHGRPEGDASAGMEAV